MSIEHVSFNFQFLLQNKTTLEKNANGNLIAIHAHRQVLERCTFIENAIQKGKV